MAKAIILYGPPGSGKGTQAELFVRKFGFIHFDTGRYIESLLRSPAAKKDPVLKREKANFDSGKLCTPEWVLKITEDEAKRVGKSGFDIVFSGSPRTVFEAFGDKKHKGLVETLEKAFGKENVHVVLLDVADETSLHRNGNRKVCSVCGLMKVATAKAEHCALCAGAFRVRSLDNPEVIKVRLVEYRERTWPIVAAMKKRGIKVSKVGAEGEPWAVSAKVEKVLKLK